MEKKRNGAPFDAPLPDLLRYCLLVFASWRDHDCIGPYRHDYEVIATVTLPAGLVMLGANRALLAIAHEVEPFCSDATLHEITLRGGGTTLAEGQVVLIRATLVGVAFDADAHSGVGLEPRDLAIECRGRVRTNVILVEVEVNRSGDRTRVDCNCCRRRDASRIRSRNRTQARVRAHGDCRRRRRWRCWRYASRARSRNVLEARVRTHCLTTGAANEQRQSRACDQVQVLCILHVIDDTVGTKGDAISQAEAKTGESAHTVVVGERPIGVLGISAVVAAHAAEAEDELRPRHDRDVVVHAKRPRLIREVACETRIDPLDSAGHLSICFQLPVRIGEENTKATAESNSILILAASARCWLPRSVVIELRVLHEATKLDHAGERPFTAEVVPERIGSPGSEVGVVGGAAKKRSEVGTNLETSLRPQVHVSLVHPGFGRAARRSADAAPVRHVVDDAVDTQPESSETHGETEVAGDAVVIAAAVEPDDSQLLTNGFIRLVAGIRRENSARSNVERGEAREGEAVANASCQRCVPDLAGLSSYDLLWFVVRLLVLDIPVGSKVGDDPSADSERIVKFQRIVELGVLPKAAQQQRTRLLCRCRSAEEQGRHCADGPTSSQHVNYLFRMVDTATTTGTSLSRLPSGRMCAGRPSLRRGEFSRPNLAIFSSDASRPRHMSTIGTYRFRAPQTSDSVITEDSPILAFVAT